MRTTTFRKLALPLAGAALLGGCIGDGGTISELPTPNRGGPLFARYVSLGNSITAGYQSGGINDSTQLQAYPVLLAAKAGAYFNAPLLNRPGCPPPYTGPLGITGRVGGGTASTCALRAAPGVFGPIQNLAVPGATVGSTFNNAQASNALTTFILGGKTQVQAMIDAQPSLVSAWIGNNDALNAGLEGDTTRLTSAALFAARVDSLATGIQQAHPMDAVLIGVVDPAVVPLLQPGAFFFLAYADALSKGQPSPFGRPVNANCAPGSPLATNLVSLAIAGAPAAVAEVNCADGAPLVLNATERQVVSARVVAFNAAIKQRADQNGWIYVDPNQILGAFLGDPARIRKCQGLAAATTPAQLATAVNNTCPSFSPAVGFGTLFSFDGVHPSASAHAVVANSLAAALNAKHGLTLPTT